MNPRQSLRPGMTAESRSSWPSATTRSPFRSTSVLQLDGKDRVAVKKADGGFEWRDVTVGDANDAEFEVKQGIKPGEQVALDPTNC